MERLIKEIKSAGGRLGCFTKDKFENEFCAGWDKAVDEAGFSKVGCRLSDQI